MKHLTCLNKNRKLKCILYSYFCHYRLIISQFWNWSRITFYFYTNTDEIFGFFIDVITHLPKRKELERYIMPLLVWNEKPTFLACLKLVEQCSKLPKISSNIFSPRNKFLPLAKVFKSLLKVSKSWKQIMMSLILPKNEQITLRIVSWVCFVRVLEESKTS